MVTFRLAILAVVLPAVVARLQLYPDPCESADLSNMRNILKPEADARLALDQEFSLEFCSTNRNTKSIIISIAPRGEQAKGTVTPRLTQLTNAEKPAWLYAGHRFYNETLQLKSYKVAPGNYWLYVDETYSPNNDDNFLSSTYNISVSVTA